MEDKTLTCKDCAQPFIFGLREQLFFAQKGFANEPQRCLPCRQTRRVASGDTSVRPTFDAVCAECGVTAALPFKPRGDRPVYCRTCYAALAPAPAFV